MSSAKRDRWTKRRVAAKRYSAAASRSETASSEFAVGRAKPRLRASAARSTGIGVPDSAPEPSGHSSARESASAKAARVAPQHLHVGEAPVAERDGLGALQVRVARHRSRGLFRGPVREARRERENEEPSPRRSRPSRRGGSPSRPGRCASGPCGAFRRGGRPARKETPRRRNVRLRRARPPGCHASSRR